MDLGFFHVVDEIFDFGTQCLHMVFVYHFFI